MWLHVEEVSGERQVVDVTSFEAGGETFNRIEIVHREDFGVWNLLEMLNDPATDPGSRTRNEDAPHPGKSREWQGGPASSTRLLTRARRT